MISAATRKLIHQRLADEVGGAAKSAPQRVALTYPSPYAAAMSSLGFQQIYRAIQAMTGVCCERVFHPDETPPPGTPMEAPVSYETLRPLHEFPVIALSVAYELELAGLIRVLESAGIPALRAERNAGHPFVIAGGPLTFSNPLPLSPFVDALIVGEAEGIVQHALATIFGARDKSDAAKTPADHPHIFVPKHHGSELPPVAKCDDEILPARSVILSPHAELSNMFLIEAERGCSRACQYCVMRRSTNGGMRVVDQETIMSLVPERALKVGLVGAAVSDHPKITQIVNALADQGKTVGLSSLRPDRLKEPFMWALKKAGYRTLTTALDGISERIRGQIERRGREPHYRDAAARTREVGMKRLKLYLMLGLPTENPEDIREGVAFVSELSRQIPIALGIAPFCAKRKTPLDGQPFAGIDVVSKRLGLLQKGLRGRADVRSTSAKWAWVEYVLAQGDEREGLAVLDAVHHGGRFAEYKKAFAPLGYTTRGEQAPRITPPEYQPLPPVRNRRLKLTGQS
jgi:radical SAM superfamily enzyme YgiQ (UPF0313 family)